MLDNIPLEYVDSYKYLGVHLNARLDPSEQWQHVYKQVCALPFLLKRLCINGWSQRELITAYQAYGLSHFCYSAAILMSCTSAENTEMTHFQNCILDYQRRRQDTVQHHVNH